MTESEIYQVKRLTEKEFSLISGPWHQLLSCSRADPLFMGWPWLYTWWQCWGRALGLELLLLAAYDRDGELRGLAPFFRYRQKMPLGLSVLRLHLLGNAWRIAPTVRTEYCGLIVDQSDSVAIRKALFSALLQESWGDLVLCDISESEASHWSDIVDVTKNVTLVHRNSDLGVRIDVSGSFSRWLGELGKNTRLKLYNRRHYLATQGALYRVSSSPENGKAFLDRLNAFHYKRWGKPCFDKRALWFHQQLIARLDAQDKPVSLSELWFDGDCVAVQYDIEAGNTRYNIQSGYLESLDAKVALGTLHLGYLIEASFNAPQVHHYDLLAGRGKNTFYKGRLKGDEVRFFTIHVVRSPLLRFIFQYQAFLPDYFRRLINRYFRF